MGEADTGRSRPQRPRSDFLARQEALLDAVGRLLARRGRGFSLPVLAKEAGLATATAYRHFSNAQAAVDAYYQRLVEGLVAELRSIPGGSSSRERYERIAVLWVRQAARWSSAAVELRSPSGFLQRVRADDVLLTDLYGELAAAVEAMISDNEIPPQSIDYAVLMWITIFDERVIADLLHTLRWSIRQTAETLQSSLLGVLSHPPLAVASPLTRASMAGGRARAARPR